MFSDKAQAKVLAAAVWLLCLPSMTQIALAAQPPDACSLLSTQEVATALGVEVDAGKSMIGAGECRWMGRAKRPGDEVAILEMNLTKAQTFEIGKTPIPGWTKSPESGIGDDAYSADSEKVVFLTSPTLSVKKGSVFLVIFVKVPKTSLEQTKAVERKVALKVVEKL